ncbi:unannotated protein [freshwater metagenome]|uniref:Unannotated protein n=1 Tax=freshwater metagenome TaxID=449393 RepID=A0A6J7HCN2_9ZZZZ|nr:5-(carboxyamino)imidazole ribonucleotide synthase [Actinomycetota bacterium]
MPTVAMVGAGQLARMTHRAAIDLGVELRVLAAAPDDPAVLAGATHLIGSPEDLGDLRRLADGADVVTFDHERIPPELLQALEGEDVRLAPPAAAKLLAQDKAHQRRVLAELGLPVPPFALVHSREETEAFAAQHGWPLVAKAPRGGYDGRGVAIVKDAAAAPELLGDGVLLEPLLALECELAVLVARTAAGDEVVYPVAETVQRDAMCREIRVPAAIAPDLAAQAGAFALEIARDAGVVGLMALELFVVDGRLLVNEVALRPHNSGHFTIEGTCTSQFEQHLRAVLGWPLGLTDLLAPAVVTVNVVGPPDGGEPDDHLARALGVPGVHVHLYGKDPAAGRKLGHVTACGQDMDEVAARAREAASILEGGRR